MSLQLVNWLQNSCQKCTVKRRQVLRPGPAHRLSTALAVKGMACSLYPGHSVPRRLRRALARRQSRRDIQLFCQKPGAAQDDSQIQGPPSAPKKPDESETVVLLVACVVGLLTGGGVVGFNLVIHKIRHLAWHNMPLEATHWCSWVRSLPLSTSWYQLMGPPIAGGLVVGAMRTLSGGLQGPPPLDPLLLRAARSQAPHHSLWPSVRFPLPFMNRGTVSESTKPSRGSTTSASEPSAPSPRPSEPRLLHLPSGTETEDSTPMEAELQAMLEQTRQASHHSPGQAESSGSSPFAPVLRALAAAVTLGTGNSLGPEGPSVDIGRSIAEGTANLLRSKKRRLSPLLAAGAGAGVAAGFNAPISGVFFAVETVLQKRGNKSTGENSEGVTIAAVLLACLASSIASQAGLGAVPAFRVPNYRIQSLYEMPLVLLLGALGGCVSSAMVYSSQVSDCAFKELRRVGAEPALLPALGGLATGIIALAYPEVLYQGFGNVNAVLDVQGQVYTAWLLSQIVVAKVVATAVCRGSGLVGGLYAPSIFTGAALGSAFGSMADRVGEATGYGVVEPQAYALVGVAAVLAGTCQVPLTAVLLLFELTHDYSIILPTLGAVGLSYWIASLPATAATLKQLLPDDAQSHLIPPSTTPWQTAVDADTLTGQLNMDIARTNTQQQQQQGRPPRARVIDQFQKLRRSLPFAGAKAEQEADEGQELVNGTEMSLSNGAMQDKKVQTLTPEQEDDRGLTVQCALEGNCVLLRRDTLLSEALGLLDDAEQSVALVIDDAGAVAGLLTRDSIVQAMAEAVKDPARLNGSATAADAGSIQAKATKRA